MFDRIKDGFWWDRPLTLVEGCTPVSPGCDNCWSVSTPFFEVLSKSLGFSFINPDITDRPNNWGLEIIAKLPFGQAVALADLINIRATGVVAKMLEPHGHELAFGDYSPGRWAC